jgi:hypothetical protein
LGKDNEEEEEVEIEVEQPVEEKIVEEKVSEQQKEVIHIQRKESIKHKLKRIRISTKVLLVVLLDLVLVLSVI